MAFAPRYIPEKIAGIQYETGLAALTTAISSATTLYAKDIAVDFDNDMVDIEIQKSSGARGPDAFIVGPEKGTVSFKIPWRGGKTSAAAAGTSPIVALGQKCGLTVTAIPAGADKVTGGTSSTITMLDADASAYFVGGFVLCNCNEAVSGVLQLRYITRKESAAGTTTLSIYPNWDTNPTNLDTLYPLDILTPTAPAKLATYTGLDIFKGQGSTDIHKIRALGCAGKFKMGAVKPGQIPWAEFEYMIDNWASSEAALTAAADGFAEPPLFLSDAFYLDATQIHIDSFEFDPGMKPIALPGQAGQGRLGWFYDDPEPSISFNPYWDNQFITDWQAKTKYKAFCQRVVDSKQAWGICVPALQIHKSSHGSIAEGMVGSELVSKIVDPGANADSTNYPLFSMAFSAD